MERLTANDLNEVCYDPWELCGMESYCKKGPHEDGGCTKGCDVLKMYRKLAEYEDLDEQGKLLKLPCAVGDTVYCIYSRYTKCSAHNERFAEGNCQRCVTECDSKKEYYINEQKAFSLDWVVTQIVNKYFGKLVFTTRQEAETALQNMKETEE